MLKAKQKERKAGRAIEFYAWAPCLHITKIIQKQVDLFQEK